MVLGTIRALKKAQVSCRFPLLYFQGGFGYIYGFSKAEISRRLPADLPPVCLQDVLTGHDEGCNKAQISCSLPGLYLEDGIQLDTGRWHWTHLGLLAKCRSAAYYLPYAFYVVFGLFTVLTKHIDYRLLLYACMVVLSTLTRISCSIPPLRLQSGIGHIGTVLQTSHQGHSE